MLATIAHPLALILAGILVNIILLAITFFTFDDYEYQGLPETCLVILLLEACVGIYFFFVWAV